MIAWWRWLVIAICALLSMFFSSADMVYSVVNQNRLENEANNGKKSAKIALKIARDYEFSIASILFGNNLVNILASSFMALVGIAWNEEWGTTVITVIFTVFIIIFAEFLPKSFSKRYSYSLSKLYAYCLFPLQQIRPQKPTTESEPDNRLLDGYPVL